MNPISSFVVVPRSVRAFQTVVGASALAVACLCSAPALAQAPAAAPTATAPAPVGNVVAGDNAAQAMSPALGSAATSAHPNPYGLQVAWGQGDIVTRTTLILLVLMSLLSWYVIVSKLLEQRRQAAQALAARTAFSNADSLQKGATALSKESPFRFLVDSAMDALRKYEALAGQVEVGAWLSQDIVRNVSTLQMRMQSGLSILATVGSTAPFVGLFGTVWGIYNALVTIGSTGQASIDKVAGPVGEALIMTALGLAVAVPAVLGYNWLVRRNRVALHSVKGFGSDLHTLFLIEIEKSRRVASRTAA
ncbi:MotA/TolQ/ExbB proton channel family protein [Rhodoferax sp. AJA081-3]|uniref:MotA/TolQ/ExbB proton channel family protein n=1 Tax=Rhodoferax sp. AJA081-3 TaxID=2752316 RepID=UPI001ADFA2F5|nr:MotA/TolQ/ExbB proton channel family protein [Rhodoferax sp. AJA081-3]